MTILLYTRRKGWPVESVTIECSHERVPASDTEKGYEDVIRQHIALKGDISIEQRDRIEYIAGRCPLHRFLDDSPTIVDHVEVAG